MIIQDEQIIEIKSDKPVPEADNIENYIDVMQIGFRKDVYGDELRKRYTQYNKQNDGDES